MSLLQLREGLTSKDYNRSLDALRGIAVSLVFLYHAKIPAFSGGFIGVEVFFVLSGFLITLVLLREELAKGKFDLSRFYMRRVLRLMPGFWFMILVFLCVCFFYFKEPVKLHLQLQDVLMAVLYVSNWTRALDLNRPFILGHTWSLSIEEQFYLVWPILLRWIRILPGINRATAIGIAILISWGWRLVLLNNGASWPRLYNGLDCRADMLLMGCLAAALWHTGQIDFRKHARWVSFLLTGGAIGALTYIHVIADQYKAPIYVWEYEVVGLATCVLILELVSFPEGIIAWLLNRKWLVWLGSISYGIYLWHYPVLWFAESAGLPIAERAWVSAALTLLFAVISWYGVERPFLHMKRRYS